MQNLKLKHDILSIDKFSVGSTMSIEVNVQSERAGVSNHHCYFSHSEKATENQDMHNKRRYTTFSHHANKKCSNELLKRIFNAMATTNIQNSGADFHFITIVILCCYWTIYIVFAVRVWGAKTQLTQQTTTKRERERKKDYYRHDTQNGQTDRQ